MIRYTTRPRAPSPPRSSGGEDYSDNAYSVVQDSIVSGAPPPPPPKTRVKNDSRRFGDSVNPSPAGSVLSSSSANSSVVSSEGSLKRIMMSKNNAASLASLYEAKGGRVYDAATVEEIKAQFQMQIESMLKSHEKLSTTNTNVSGSNNHSLGRNVDRGKSFQEARNVVQRHIERMFNDNSSNNKPSLMQQPKREIKHAMHGVSHALPGQDHDDIKPPPPVHHGVNQALKNRTRIDPDSDHEAKESQWQSVGSLLKESSQAMESKNKFRSMENISRGLTRTPVVDVDLDHVDVSDRMRRFKMENGKSLPNLSLPKGKGCYKDIKIFACSHDVFIKSSEKLVTKERAFYDPSGLLDQPLVS